MKTLYPFDGKYFEQPGNHRQHYLDEGQGEPVVMVHGNPTWSFFYRNVVNALKGTHRCLVPDHIGCGLSDKPDDATYSYTLERRVHDLDRLIEHRVPGERLSLIVHDWGGMIGMAWATAHPERIQRLVVMNTAAFPKPASKRFPWQLHLCRNTLLGPLLVRGLNGFCRYAVRHCSVKPLPADVAASYLLPYDSWRNRIAVLRFVQDIPLQAGDPGFELISRVAAGLEKLRDVPMLICWGEQDFVFDGHFLEEWRRRFPDADVHAFPEAGHYVLEDAGDKIVPLIQQFLT